jgi:hypothetical protein
MKAIYVSVWDGSTEIRSSCEFNPETKDVTNIESVDVDGIDICFEEFIELPTGEIIKEFTIDGEILQ